MRKNISLFLLIFSLSHAVYSENVPFENSSMRHQLEEVIEQAKLYRIDPDCSDRRNVKRQREIRGEICGRLSHYGEQLTVIEIVELFVKDCFKQREFSSTWVIEKFIKPTRRMDQVFLIKDREGRLQFVVKSFAYPRKPSSLFLLEISALDFLRQHHFQNVLPIHPLAVGLGESNGVEYGLLLETAATGKRIDDFIKIYTSEKDPGQRDHHMNLLERAFIRLAKGLEELHAMKSSKSGIISEWVIDKFISRKDFILSDPFIRQSLEQKMDVSALDSYLESVVAFVQSTPIYFSYSHRDTNLGNLIYDEVLDKIYFIDVAQLHNSISYYGEPVADGLRDLIRVEESLLKLNLLTTEEAEHLIKVLHATYEEQSQNKINWRFLQFYQDGMKMGTLRHYSRYEQLSDERERSRTKLLFNKAIDYFKDQVEQKNNQ